MYQSNATKNSVTKNSKMSRIGMPQDCASLVRFLCSPEGGWVNAQLLYSDVGLEYT